MYKRILVISDNQFMMQKFADIIAKKHLGRSVDVSFAISPYSVHAKFKLYEGSKAIEVKIVDLKNTETVKKVIDSADLIFSIHCKQLFPKYLVENVKCINVHPGYNPINRGWYPQVFAIINHSKIGATIHEIDENLDHGDIIDRGFVEKKFTDTSLTLYNRILSKEIELIEKNITSIIDNTYKTIKPEEEGTLYLKRDFRKLTEIDLHEKLSGLDFINRLRALTHGHYQNAYFINPDNGKKVFISINLNEEEDASTSK